VDRSTERPARRVRKPVNDSSGKTTRRAAAARIVAAWASAFRPRRRTGWQAGWTTAISRGGRPATSGADAGREAPRPIWRRGSARVFRLLRVGHPGGVRLLVRVRERVVEGARLRVGVERSGEGRPGVSRCAAASSTSTVTSSWSPAATPALPRCSALTPIQYEPPIGAMVVRYVYPPLSVTRTAGRRPALSPITTAAGTSMPVAVLPASWSSPRKLHRNSFAGRADALTIGPGAFWQAGCADHRSRRFWQAGCADHRSRALFGKQGA